MTETNEILKLETNDVAKMMQVINAFKSGEPEKAIQILFSIPGIDADGDITLAGAAETGMVIDVPLQKPEAGKTKIHKIDTSRLEIGRAYKNYRELCGVLGEPVLGGDSKRAQIKEFNRYFEVERVGQKFIILDIYSEPLPREDGRSAGNNSIYVKSIEILLLQYLKSQSHYSCTFTRRQLWKLLGMVNQNYHSISDNELIAIEPKKITKFQISHFYQRADGWMRRILASALKNLRNRRLISYDEQVVVIPVKGEKFIATDKERKHIDYVEHEVLQKMGLVSISQVYASFKTKEFYGAVNELLEKRYGWKETFQQYKLIYTQANIESDLPEIGKELERRISFNNFLADKFIQDAAERYKKQQAKVDSKVQEMIDAGDIPDVPDVRYSQETRRETGIFEYPRYYVEAQRILTEKLIRIVSKSFQYHPETDKDLDDLFAERENLTN
ncbi:MAG: hypothetical protein Q4F21_13145 [Lachnospiraceae bacterium]|nr:hypothetical protein [Lachnospiraceae bacterium]